MKLYIDNDLKLRASETGWPEKPPIGPASIYEDQAEAYDKALAKAKEESLVVYDQDGFACVNNAGTKDSFVDFPIEVEFVKQVKGYGEWIDVADAFRTDEEFRTIARLKPQNSAHSFTEGHIGDIANPFMVPSDPGVKAYYDAAHVDPEREAFEQGLDRTLNLQEQNEHLRTERAKYKELWHLDRKRSLDLLAQLDAANKRVAELEGAMADMITAPVYPAGLKDRILESFDKGNMRNPYDELERVLEENGII